jgi:hypothetical protein
MLLPPPPPPPPPPPLLLLLLLLLLLQAISSGIQVRFSCAVVFEPCVGTA